MVVLRGQSPRLAGKSRLERRDNWGEASTLTDQAAPTLDELRAKRELILHVAAVHGVTNLRVFGSVARGDAGPRSDVDFLVDLPPECSGWNVFGVLDELRHDLEITLGRHVDVITIRGPSPDAVPMAARIEREAFSL